MTRITNYACLLLITALAGCSEVEEQVLTPSVLNDRSRLGEISRRLNGEDKAHLHEYVVGYRLAQLDPETAPIAYGAGAHKVSEAIEISRYMRRADTLCQHKLKPIAARLAEVRRARAR